MNRKIIIIPVFAALLAMTGCDNSMLADHPVDKMRSNIIVYGLGYAAYLNQPPVSVSGRVVLCSLNNTGNPNVRMTLTGSFETRIIYTDSSGNYTFNDMRPGDFILTAYREGYNFIPEQQSVHVTAGGASNVSFETMVTFDRKIGGAGWDKANSIIQTNDCSYIAVGYSDSHNNVGNKDFIITKIGINGNEEWRKIYGGSSSEIAYSISKTNDNNYVIACGYTFSDTMGLNDFYVTKVNVNNSSSGEWQKLYGGTGQEVAYSIKPTSDNGYIVAGYTDSQGAGENDIQVIKLDSDGNSVWPDGVGVFGGEHSDSANAIIEVSEGGYIVAGNREDASGNYDLWIIRLNLAGGIIWDKTFNKGEFDDASDIQETSDGGFIVAGYTDQGTGHYWILKLDASGNVEWEKLDNSIFTSALYTIRQTRDGGYIAAGRIYSYATTDNDMYVLKFNSSGEIEWQKTFDGDYRHEDIARSIQQTSDGGYIVAGYTTTYENKTDMWIIKLNREGEIVP